MCLPQRRQQERVFLTVNWSPSRACSCVPGKPTSGPLQRRPPFSFFAPPWPGAMPSEGLQAQDAHCGHTTLAPPATVSFLPFCLPNTPFCKQAAGDKTNPSASPSPVPGENLLASLKTSPPSPSPLPRRTPNLLVLRTCSEGGPADPGCGCGEEPPRENAAGEWQDQAA